MFCLITSLARRRWGFPKGIVEPGETLAEAALKESWEEAGLRGELVGAPLGKYAYAKWGTTLAVTVVLLRVTEVAEEWQEAQLRERRWVSADEARALLDQPDQRRLLEVACRRIAAQSSS